VRQVDDADADDADDPHTCQGCGNPLPLDGRCSCAGDPDLDARVGLRALKHDRTYTTGGMKRFPLAAIPAEVPRR
jgi:hypothetical protein